MSSFKILNKIDSAIFWMYASDNRYSEDIYFTQEAEDESGICTELCKKINGFEDAIIKSKNFNFRHFLGENKESILNIMSSNSKYLQYLEEKNSNIDYVGTYIDKMASLDDSLLKASFYLTLVLIWIITIKCFHYRRGFYIFTAFLYTVVMASSFSNGILDYVFSNMIDFLAKINRDIFTYQDMSTFKLYFVDAIKESTMTVIIFDTIFQFASEKKRVQREKNIRYIYQTMDMQIKRLKNSVSDKNEWIGRLKVPSSDLEKECIREAKKNRKKMERQKRVKMNTFYYRYLDRYNIYNSLYQNLHLIRTNTESHATQHYIVIMEKIEDLMIQCGYNKI